MTNKKLQVKVINMKRLIDKHDGILRVRFPNEEAKAQFYRRFSEGYCAISDEIEIEGIDYKKEEEEENKAIGFPQEENRTIGFPHGNEAWRDYNMKPPNSFEFDYTSSGELEFITIDGVRYHLLKMGAVTKDVD